MQIVTDKKQDWVVGLLIFGLFVLACSVDSLLLGIGW